MTILLLRSEKMSQNFDKDEIIFTVSQYNKFINEHIGMQAVVVEGEVSNCREIPGRNFRYFDIKDEQAVARCFQGFWKSRINEAYGQDGLK